MSGSNLSRGEIIVEARDFFFEAMRKGYAGGAEKTSIPGLPGIEAIPYKFDGKGYIVDFYLMDWYAAPEGSLKSAGSTMIWYKDQPVWVMHYGGFYQNKAIPFLKEALFTAYQRRMFYGGRGQSFYLNPEWEMGYINRLASGDFFPMDIEAFESFEGREEIFDLQTSESLGWHRYWGCTLI